jgi:hypothetical protein
MTQSPQVKDLGMSGGVRANLRVIGLVSPKNMTAVEALVSTQLIPKPDGGMDELREIMAASPVGRAVFDGKIARWLPMPKLENHSGFDRDARKFADGTAPETRSPEPSPETTRLSVGQVNWERIKVGSPAYPEATDAIEVESWEAEEPIEVPALTPEELQQRREKREARERIDSQLVKIHVWMDQSESLSIKDIQKKLKLDTSTEAQQLAQMFCLREKGRYQFKTKNNPNSTVSYFIERAC